jgi:hypothetical protein
LAGAGSAARTGRISSLGALWRDIPNPLFRQIARAGIFGSTLICGVLAQGSTELVFSELKLATPLPMAFQHGYFYAPCPLDLLTSDQLRPKVALDKRFANWLGMLFILWLSQYANQWLLDAEWSGAWPALIVVSFLVMGGPIFLVLGALSWVLFAQEGIPMASLALSHYQITVNPSLPALPLFTLAGLIFANTQAALRLSQLFTAVFGTGQNRKCPCSRMPLQLLYGIDWRKWRHDLGNWAD